MESIKQQLNKLPQAPGVYIFRGRAEKIIYIGKATSLRDRVRSYFSGKPQTNRPIETMIHEVVKIGHQKTDSVLEALILEANLIKKYLPKYNVKEKDDKSFSYFGITKEDFPRVLILRETELDSVIASRAKQSRSTTSGLPRRPRRTPRNDNEGYKKIFGPYTSKRQMEVALKIIRKIFPFHSVAQKTEKGCLDFQMGRCPGPYAGAISKKDYNKNIRGIQMILEGKKKSLMQKLKKEMAEYAKQQKFEKAAEIRNKIFALQHIQDVALISKNDDVETQNLTSLHNAIRIEAYDISSIGGQQAVGSMVVFENDKPNKKEYRKFKIKTVEGANDVAMMREVLLRRFNNPWTQPDLIILDGGKGHLNMAQKLLHDLGFVIPLVAVAKGPTRKKMDLYVGNYALSKEINNILSNENALKRIMDEAHRFAIGYHRKVRRREFKG